MKTRIPLLLAAGLLLVAGTAPAQEIIEAARSGDLAKVKELAAANPGVVNAKDPDGRTPLHWACRGVHLEVLEFLLARGADGNTGDRNGASPLHWATMAGHASMVKLLLDHGADPSARDANGDTPLNLAASQGFRETVDLLLDREAQMDTSAGKALVLLQAAARQGLARLFRAVVEKEGQSLFADAETNRWTMQDTVSGGSVDILEVLLARNVHLAGPADIYGWTPIHYAASGGRLAMVEFLAQRGFDLNERTKAGESAFNLAQAAGNQEAQALIVRLGGKSEPPKFPLIQGPYLGQKTPGMKPEIFAPGIVSRPDVREMGITFAPDGRELYFYRILGNGHSRIYCCRTTGGAWTAPEEAAFSSAYSASLPFLALDGKYLFFVCGVDGKYAHFWIDASFIEELRPKE